MEKEVFVTCRSDKDNYAPRPCGYNRASITSPAGSPVAMFKCKKCGYAWSVAVGGHINV